MFVTKVIKVGNSLAVIIPSYLCKELDWKVGTKVSVILTPDRNAILIKKINITVKDKS